MSTDLTIPGFGNLDLVNIQNAISRYSDREGAGDIIREGMRQIITTEIQNIKTIKAIELAGEIHRHAQSEALKYTNDVASRVQEVAHGEDHNGHYPPLANDLAVMHGDHIKGIVQVGLTNIARVVAEDVDVPKPREEKKRGWFGR